MTSNTNMTFKSPSTVVERQKKCTDIGDEEQNHLQSLRLSKNILIVSYAAILFTQLVESFAQDSTSELATYATSEFNSHSMVSTSQLAYKITAVCAYPILGKIADLLGRGEGFGIVVFFYTLCYILFASCPNVATFIVGYVFFAIGRVGFKTMLYIFIADCTDLVNRAALTQLPAAITGIITTYAGSYVEDAFLENSSWRWDYGAWAIILGVSVIPLTLIIFHCDRTLKKRGDRKQALISYNLPEGSFWHKAKHVVLVEMDLIGCILLMAGTSLFFVPFTITGNTNTEKWSDASTIVMLVIGFITLVLFGIWCYFFDKLGFLKNRLPFIPLRSFRNHTVLVAFIMVALDYCENAAFNVYFSTALQVGGYYTAGQAGRINDSKKVSIDIASIITGLLMKYTKRSKIWVLIGVPVLVLGHGLLVWFMSRNEVMERTVLLYVMEIFTGVGRAFYTTSLQVTIQAISGIEGVAMSTAFFLAFSSVGTLIGTAIAGGIWNNVAYNRLVKYLPDEAKKNATAIFANMKVALKFKEGSEVRTAISLAYRETVQIIGWAALGIVAPCLLLMFFVREVELTEEQDLYGSVDEVEDQKSISTEMPKREKRTLRNWWRV